ncbi:MAG: glycosyl hydrolase, partial [Lachnospiraceae bacterium]|nr:glycosyl hydrolase [Lachnospiraceae bacterium]
MGKNREKATELVSQMTLEEKAGMCSGLDCWLTKPVERLGLKSIMVSDGPHGLRKQENTQDNLGIGESVKATCFPTASLLACSFDPKLLYKVGSAIADEAKAEQVSVLLGPGINIKRSPLCGRNFEYFSEDPIVAGRMGAGFIKGVQSKGIGTSLKHFAVNNQERRRMSISAAVDKRTLHEIYLKGFEIAVKEAKPRTVMCSYNKINGVYSSENKELLTDILRKKWGYEGMVVSDWGAVHDRPMGVDAGLDLEMPGSLGVNDRKIIKAVEEGRLSMEALDRAAVNVTELVLDGLEKI